MKETTDRASRTSVIRTTEAAGSDQPQNPYARESVVMERADTVSPADSSATRYKRGDSAGAGARSSATRRLSRSGAANRSDRADEQGL